MINELYYDSPIGKLLVKEEQNTLIGIDFCEEEQIPDNWRLKKGTPFLKECVKQLEDYFAGKRNSFELKINLTGTCFQKEVWAALNTIPYGEVASYKAIAEKIGRPKAMRAVGSANHNNPVPIVIPCHRIIGANGKMVGYGGGLWRKEWLLNHESNHRFE